MKLLVIRGDLQSHSGYSAAARDYCRVLKDVFDRVIGVDIHFSPERPFERFPFPLVDEAEARRQAAAESALILSFTTPDCYARYEGAVNVGLTFWETDRFPLQGAAVSPWVRCANAMDAVWAPCTSTKEAFEKAGVTVPVRVIPWPIRPPAASPDGLPDGCVYDLDRRPWLASGLVHCARLPSGSSPWLQRLRASVSPRAAAVMLSRLRSSPRAIPSPREQALLCVAQDVPRKGLLLFLSEWMEFKRRPEARPWSLILKTSPIDPRTLPFDFVMRFWEHVQALRRQLRVDRSGLYLWTGQLHAADYERLFANTYSCIAPSFGEGFCGPAATALALGKPLIAPRHSAFADYVAEDYRYAYESRPVIVSFVGDPLRVYDPASSWGVPVPFALCEALSRFAQDSSRERAEVGKKARAHLLRWCGPDRLKDILLDEVRRLTPSTRSRMPLAA
jgi:glycosyltransferase involved in cell wall biosynthesis